MWLTISLGIVVVFSFISMVIVLEYMQKMERIKMGGRQEGGKEVMAAIEALRQEVAELRDTTTRYDLSFDTALQRMESRVSHIEKSHSQAPRPLEQAREQMLDMGRNG